jgi:solute carrier family 25 oxoglutarate transporter 11
MALNLGQLTGFSQAKAVLKQAGLPDRYVPLTASAIAGFFASFFSLPFDFVKTRLQKQSRTVSGDLQYRGFADCAVKTYREAGLFRL